MIAIFLNIIDAQKFSDKCHNWLQLNCPDYSASCWQIPVSNKTNDKFYVEIPQEFYKQLYKNSGKIVVFTDTEFKKASETMEKPFAEFITEAKT